MLFADVVGGLDKGKLRFVNKSWLIGVLAFSLGEDIHNVLLLHSECGTELSLPSHS